MEKEVLVFGIECERIEIPEAIRLTAEVWAQFIYFSISIHVAGFWQRRRSKMSGFCLYI